MISDLIRLVIYFFSLLLVQIAVLNNINLGGFINPFVYVLFILILPVRTPGPLLLVIGFFMGLLIDMFSNSMGMHAAATVFMAYLRPTVLKFVAPRDGYETESIPSIREFGLNWFLVYSSVLVFMHHLMLFLIEVFRVSELHSTLLRVVLSTLVTVSVLVMIQFLTDKPQQKK
jgi:rod shape-determining protein MreD